MRTKRAWFLLFFISATMLAQQPWSWREHVFVKDGFAATFPYPPNPHADVQLENATVYTVNISADQALSIRALRDPRNCADIFAQLKQGVATRSAGGILKDSARSFTVAGYPAYEYRRSSVPGRVALDRYVCANGRFYVFSAAWNAQQGIAAATTRILDSFRILPNIAKATEPLPPAIPDPGSVSGSTYTNSYFGFTYSMPDAFRPTTLQPDAMRFFNGRDSVLLFVASGLQGPSGTLLPNMRITAWREAALWGAEVKTRTGKDYLDKLRTMSDQVVPVGQVTVRKIAGRTFYQADGKSKPAKVGVLQGFQRNLVTSIRGFYISFILEAPTSEEMERIDHSLESLRFE